MSELVAPAALVRGRAGTLVMLIARYGIYVALLLMCIGGVLISTRFLTTTNFLSIALSVGYTGFTATGMAFVVISGSLVDLSIPGVVAASGLIALAAEPAVGAVPAILIAIAAGCFVGLINGVAVGYLKVNAVLATYAAQIIALGISQAVVGGGFVNAHGSVFKWLGTTTIGRVPLVLPILGVVMLAAYVLLHRSTFGRKLFATGGGYQAARVAGIRVRRIVMTSFVISGALAALCGVLLSANLGNAQTTIGSGYDFASITAVAVGGTSLFGGAGTIGRVLAGVLVIGVLNDLLILAGVSINFQGIVQGAIIIGAVALDVALRRLRTR